MSQLRLLESPGRIPLDTMVKSVQWAGLPFAKGQDALDLLANPQRIKTLLLAHGHPDADRIEFPGETQQRGGELSLTVHPVLVRQDGQWKIVWETSYRGLVAVH